MPLGGLASGGPHLSRSLTALALAALFVVATPALATSTLYEILLTNTGGVVSVTDPAGFSCVYGSAPFHNPPNSVERRCTPTFAVLSCGDLSAAGDIVGVPGASVAVNAQCSDGLMRPPFAGCAAMVPPASVTASCSNTPPPHTTTLAFEFVCHAPATGVWIEYHAKCQTTIVT